MDENAFKDSKTKINKYRDKLTIVSFMAQSDEIFINVKKLKCIKYLCLQFLYH